MFCAAAEIGKCQVGNSAHDGKWYCSGDEVQASPLKPLFDSPGQPNLFYVAATKLDCGNDREGNHEVMWK